MVLRYPSMISGLQQTGQRAQSLAGSLSQDSHWTSHTLSEIGYLPTTGQGSHGVYPTVNADPFYTVILSIAYHCWQKFNVASEMQCKYCYESFCINIPSHAVLFMKRAQGPNGTRNQTAYFCNLENINAKQDSNRSYWGYTKNWEKTPHLYIKEMT